VNLVILHYHLNRGGVARVIEYQLRALDAVLDPAERLNVAVLHGGRSQGWNEGLASQLQAVDLRLAPVSGLDYDEKNRREAPSRLLERLVETIAELGFRPDETVIQIHNHSLGKNVSLSVATAGLAEKGFGLLLQVHDFAEDFRPANYRKLAAVNPGELYPQSPGIHYAVLNGRDRAILRDAGVDDDRLHLLPNPVPPMDGLPNRDAARAKLGAQFAVRPDQRFVLYPVRGIRRKNLGEMLLVSLLSPAETVVGLTLAPLNPIELPAYAAWEETAVELDLPCRFAVGGPEGLAFAENLAAADAILTTSVAEGFGMVMLEPWSAGRTLLGRNLPEITVDFTRAGLRLDSLWNRLGVPADWIGRERFVERLCDSYRQAVAAFERPLPPDWEETLQTKIADDASVDFADLDEAMQRDVLRKVASNARSRAQLSDLNTDLGRILSVDTSLSFETIDHNAKVVEAEYSLAPSGRRLWGLLRRILEGPHPGTWEPLPDPDRILSQLLNPRRFRMLRG
jgi:hypothetical protein